MNEQIIYIEKYLEKYLIYLTSYGFLSRDNYIGDSYRDEKYSYKTYRQAMQKVKEYYKVKGISGDKCYKRIKVIAKK